MRRLAAALIFLTMSLIPASALAFNPFPNDCNGAASSSTVCNPSGGSGSSSNSIANEIVTITRVVAIVTGIIAVIMLLVGSIKYMIAGGDANDVKSAKNTIIYSLVAILVVALAQSIVVFVVDRI